IGTSVALFPLGLLAMAIPQTLSGGDLNATALRVVVFGGFTAAIALAALTGIIAAVREDAALARLQGAARRLTPPEAAKLAAKLSRLPGDENRETISVLRAVLEGEPSELAPAAAPA